MSIINTAVPITAESCDRAILELVKTYPFCRTEVLATTAYQRPLRTLVIGNGPGKLLLSASHHANEWITTLILLKYAEDLCMAYMQGSTVDGFPAAQLLDAATVYMVPMVNPDGVDLVTGAIVPGSIPYEIAQEMSRFYPAIPFPSGWKANLKGVDLNLQYPAGWLQAREIKFGQGFTRPGPRDYVGRAPLDQIESRAMAGYTEFLEPDVVIAFHSQGKEIYWQFEDIEVPGARALGEALARASGYTLTDTPYESSFAGYKDWFIKTWRRPGYTVEVGRGTNPLPIEQFPEIYEACRPLITTAILEVGKRRETTPSPVPPPNTLADISV